MSLAAGLHLDQLGELTAFPRLLARFKGEVEWKGKGEREQRSGKMREGGIITLHRQYLQIRNLRGVYHVIKYSETMVTF